MEFAKRTRKAELLIGVFIWMRTGSIISFLVKVILQIPMFAFMISFIRRRKYFTQFGMFLYKRISFLKLQFINLQTNKNTKSEIITPKIMISSVIFPLKIIHERKNKRSTLFSSKKRNFSVFSKSKTTFHCSTLKAKFKWYNGKYIIKTVKNLCPYFKA